MLPQFLAQEISLTGTDRLYKPGQIVLTLDSAKGPLLWRYIQNVSGSAIPQYAVVDRASGAADNMQGQTCTTAKQARFGLLGVAQHEIPAGHYGFVLVSGIGKVLGDGAVTAGSSLVAEGTGGQARNATLTAADEVAGVFGIALTDDGAAGSSFDAHINIP